MLWGISLPENDRERQARRKIDHTGRNVAGLPYADGTKLKSTQIALLATAARPPDLLWLYEKKKSTEAFIVSESI